MNNKFFKDIGFLASGRGSNVRAIVKACREGKLDANPAVIISNNSDAEVLTFAKDEGIPHYHISRKTHPDPDTVITDIFRQHNISLVILAGYMKKIGTHLLSAYKNRIINIHPSLLPKFGGKGMYGLKIHQAVIAAGDKETGVTIHLVNEEYDQGNIIAQEKLEVRPDDTPDTLAERVLATEHGLYSLTIQRIISGEIELPKH